MAPNTFLITSATGNCGAPLVHKLLAKGHKVHALTNTPDSERAQELAAAGAAVIKASLDDEPALAAAAKGCDGVFLNPTPPDGSQTSAERELAGVVLKVCKAAGVKTVVYDGVADAWSMMSYPEWDEWVKDTTFIGDYWRAKHGIEGDVRTSGIPSWTVIAGSTYFSNFGPGKLIDIVYPALHEKPVGKLKWSVDKNTRIQLVDPADLATFAALALTEPARFNGKHINVYGDTKTVDEIAEIMSKYGGKRIEAVVPPADVLRAKRQEDLFVGLGQMAQFLSVRVDWTVGPGQARLVRRTIR